MKAVFQSETKAVNAHDEACAGYGSQGIVSRIFQTPSCLSQKCEATFGHEALNSAYAALPGYAKDDSQGRSPDSRLERHFSVFPVFTSDVRLKQLGAYSCGDSPGIKPDSLLSCGFDAQAPLARWRT